MNPTTTKEDPLLPETALGAYANALASAVSDLYPEAPASDIVFESPRNPDFGDFSTNVAFSLARFARRPPQEVATALIASADARQPELRQIFSAITPVAGFINVRLGAASWQAAVARVLDGGGHFGETPKHGQRISLEFGSANPTGPLVVVQGRTLSIGATLAAAMRYCGYDVFVEWIINDAGGQLDTLARSLYARYRQQSDADFPFPADGYPGEYLHPIAAAIAKRDGTHWHDAAETEWLPFFAQAGRDALVAEQRQTVARFGVTYDHWQSERELHESGRVRQALQILSDGGLTYEKDGALFFKATKFGDDKDRVLVRTDGRPTYLAPDVAYHHEKLRRSDRVIDILGPDHHGYIGRLHGLAEALGYKGHLDVLIAQQVTLMRGSREVSMSKRAGDIVTLDEIIDEVGVDAARFFFAMLAPESPLTFDLELAKEESNDNPVFYVQYGHARIASVIRNADAADIAAARSARPLCALTHQAELVLARRINELPRVVRNAVDNLAPHRLTRYARELAADFHQFYSACKILTENREQRVARLALCLAAQSVLAQVLGILGVSAPLSMERAAPEQSPEPQSNATAT
ncbi:MAG: arginine--tRNA ligase [Candidatus Eremiobacteraeota bacterium]|nr:arginine--tRNA ligase [Candidatus Eremiobacteraeota bacterium]